MIPCFWQRTLYKPRMAKSAPTRSFKIVLEGFGISNNFVISNAHKAKFLHNTLNQGWGYRKYYFYLIVFLFRKNLIYQLFKMRRYPCCIRNGELKIIIHNKTFSMQKHHHHSSENTKIDLSPVKFTNSRGSITKIQSGRSEK